MKAPPKLKVLKGPICWEFLKSEYMKFNVDGSYKGKSEPMGIGGVLRDCSIVTTHRLIIESNSCNVVKWVLNPHGTPWATKKYMAHIEVYKAQLLGWEICHISREGNDIADALAKSGILRQDELFLVYEQ
ncbi:hypothetical protein CRYUN_Cryun10bG0000600 [Craigia yunnanensis]